MAKNKTEDKILYWVDTDLEYQTRLMKKKGLNCANNLLQTYQDVTGLKIQSTNEFHRMADNPMLFFKKQWLETKGSKVMDMVGGGIDLTNLVKAPDQFDMVLSIAGELKTICKRRDCKPEDFMYSDNQILMNPSFENEIQLSCYWYATTPNEKARLELCQRLIEFYESNLEPLIQKTDGHRPNSAYLTSQKCYLSDKDYLLKKTPDFTTRKLKLRPNPIFVRKGFVGFQVHPMGMGPGITIQN